MVTSPNWYEASDGKISATFHGIRRLAESNWTMAQYQLTKQGMHLLQQDGAHVYVHRTRRGRFNVIIEGTDGVITAKKNLGRRALDGLAENYHWTEAPETPQ